MKRTRRELLEGSFNVVGAATYIFSCAMLVIDYEATRRFSDIFMLARRFLYAIFFVTRKTPPKQTNKSPRDWMVAFAGTYMQNLLVPQAGGHDVLFWQCVQALGFLVCIAGVMALNESFGVVAANRGIKTDGIYKYIRHPLYAGYFIESTSFIAQNLSAQNLIVMGIWTLFQFRRIHIEEQYLAADPEYQAYVKRVPWRLIPHVY